jgi:opacity protein-like surface antigen
MPLGSSALRSDRGRVNIRNSSLYDFTVCAHIRVPLRDKWEPYGILGAAGLYSLYQIASIPGPGLAAVYSHRSAGSFGFATGFGVRYRAAENWGVRSEWNVTVSTRNFGRFVTGLFYEFE